MENKERVEHPEHYKLNIEIEVLDIIELLVENIQGKKAFIVGNVIKYLLRADKKNGIEDYKKARFYLEKKARTRKVLSIFGVIVSVLIR